jgi:START domain
MTCDSDEDDYLERVNMDKPMQGWQEEEEVKATGDFKKDFYLDLPKITNEEEKSFILLGKKAVEDLWVQSPQGLWTVGKKNRDCQIFHRKSGSTHSCYRLHCEFDFPVDLVVDYFRTIEKRMSWDDGFDHLKFVRTFQMNTSILLVRIKAQWPLGPREALLLFQGLLDPENGNVYLGSQSVEHPEYPIDPTGKLVRV